MHMVSELSEYNGARGQAERAHLDSVHEDRHLVGGQLFLAEIQQRPLCLQDAVGLHLELVVAYGEVCQHHEGSERVGPKRQVHL